jgi:hypothetical protein
MARLFIGHDSNGIPALKITRDSSDAPGTTPDAERSKFSYNSNDDALAEINEVLPPVTGTLDPAEWGNAKTFPFSPNSVRVYFSPPTTDETDYERATVRTIVGGVETPYGPVYYSTRYFETLPYACPILSDAYRKASNGRYANIVTSYVATLTGGGYVLTTSSAALASPPQSVNVTSRSASVGSDAFECRPPYTSVKEGVTRCRAVLQSSGGPLTVALVLTDIIAETEGSVGSFDRFQVVWNLPADNTPLAVADKITGTSGVKVISINPNEFKIARQGHDVDTATFDELMFSAERRPAKIIAAGDVLVAAGTTHEIECNVTLDDTVVVEQAIYDTATIAFPFPPNLYIDNAWNFEYKVEGTKVVLYNDAAANYRVRYMVIAADDQPATSGSNKAFREIDIDGETVFQILRPGSADPPTLADIIIDSRWPSTPILAEGYLDVLSAYAAAPLAGYQGFTVNFDNPDNLFPFVKFSVVREVGANHVACPPVVRKRVGQASTGTDADRIGGDTTWCDLNSNTQAVFNAFRGRVIELGFSTFVQDSYPVGGIRYFIFGIPT